MCRDDRSCHSYGATCGGYSAPHARATGRSCDDRSTSATRHHSYSGVDFGSGLDEGQTVADSSYGGLIDNNCADSIYLLRSRWIFCDREPRGGKVRCIRSGLVL
jgi:hypothetical protein